MSYHITALRGLDNFDNIDIKEDIAINNTGYYKFDTTDTSVSRLDGRFDYHLKYVKEGKGYFIINGEEHIVPAGNIILYRPHEPQIYRYYGRDNIKSYWIHFGGTKVESMLKSLKLDDLHIMPYANSSLFISTVNYIFDELQLKKPFYQLSCTSKLTELLVNIHRHKNLCTAPFSNAAVEEILAYISKNYHLPTTNDEYAAMCNMCTSYFVKLFKMVTGTTPQHYKMLQRIQMSEQLLTSENYSISEAANLVGYSDALYFSRIFKKINGVSPSQFVENYRR